jgi:hypothetical protein
MMAKPNLMVASPVSVPNDFAIKNGKSDATQKQPFA